MDEAMAKLSITRPRMHWLERAMPNRRGMGYDIVVDGRCVRSIEPGETIKYELRSGHHEVRAKSSYSGSQPVEIDGTPDGTRQFAVGSSSRWKKLNLIAIVFIILSVLQLIIGMSLSVSQQRRPGIPAAVDTVWFSVLKISTPFMFILAMLFQLSLQVFCRNHVLDLVEIPGPDMTYSQIAKFLRSQPFRVRITIRHMMIAVAVLAAILALTIQWLRHDRSRYFRWNADMHSSLEATSRESWDRWDRISADVEKGSADEGYIRQMAGRSAAKAAYHEAMRRKYEQAASQGRVYVEPDPPEPPSP
jgi:hypothetical protein